MSGLTTDKLPQEPAAIAGSLMYASPKVWCVRRSENLISVEPVDPRTILRSAYLFFVLFYAGMVSFFFTIFGTAMAIGMAIGLGFMTLLSVSLCRWIYTHEGQSGPWLIFDLTAKNITLPRHDATFRLEEVIRFEIVSGHDSSPNSDRAEVSELHLLTTRDTGTICRHVLVGGVNPQQIWKEARPLIEAVGKPCPQVFV